MSGSCREVYYNYGSYLRSRGNDKALCELIIAIENGLINLGPITPGSCNTNTATTILGKVNINPCSPATQQTSGKLTVNGGWIGPTANNPSGLVNTFLANAINFGLTTNTGANIIGPIFQNTDCSHSNYFGAGNHIFAGSNDCSANVIIRGNLSFYDNNVLTSSIYSNGDASFNGTVDFITNPRITQGPAYDNRILQIYGQSTIVLDISTSVFNISNPLPSNATTDLSFIVPPIYSDFNPPSVANSIFTANYIDFSNNQLAVQDMTFEIYLTVKCHFASTTDYLTFQFEDIDNPSNIIEIDTRTSVKNTDTTLTFGPQIFVFDQGNPSSDIALSTKIWKISVAQSGSGAYFTNNARFIMKTKGFT